MKDKSLLNHIRKDNKTICAGTSDSLDHGSNTIIDVNSGCMHLSLIYPEGCGGGCSYCILGRDMANDSTSDIILKYGLSYSSVDEMIALVDRNRDTINQVCVSTTVHPGSFDEAFFLVEYMSQNLNLPVSIKMNPLGIKKGDLSLFSDAGADKVVIVIDAATENLFMEHKGNGVEDACSWNNHWDATKDAAHLFGGRNTFCQLIVGLGESERQLLETIQAASDIGARTSLFPFYADSGSLMDGAEECAAGQYRRMQLAGFLIEANMSGVGNMGFDEKNRVVSFGLMGEELENIVDSGIPFGTSSTIGFRPCARIWQPESGREDGGEPPEDHSAKSKNSILNIRKQLATYRETNITARREI